MQCLNFVTFFVAEHKKMSSALDKCPYCFNNIPKHLIIAIGMKVRTIFVYKIIFLLSPALFVS